MRTLPVRFRVTQILFILATCIAMQTASASPRIFWVSDPVRPDETVLLQGSDLGASEATVEMAPLENAKPTAPASLPKNLPWTRVPVLQGSDQSLKFVVPAKWGMGVFACRVSAGGAASETVLLNAPDPWWAQGDEGQAASPGGWLRIQGKCLATNGHALLSLEPEQGPSTQLQPTAADEFCLRFNVPADLKPGAYTLRVHNGSGGDAAWRTAGKMRIEPAPVLPPATFSVLEMYGPDAARKMRDTLIKYSQPIDRTEGILAALKKAKENGGGTVFFPAGRYTIRGPLVIPEHTLLKGEGTGLVTLWWGTGHFNLDGGGPQGRARVEEPKPPSPLIYGPDFAIEDVSLYLPLEYEQGLVADKRLRMRRVRVRIDHYWLVQGRGNGAVARLGRNFQVTECDILAKGDALVPGQFGVIAHNRIMANKSNTPMGGSHAVILEDNQFVSMDPTAYQNLAGCARDVYYAHNHHESLYAQQADYSFTFDASAGAYLGAIAEARGTQLTLAADPAYPKWAPEKHDIWRRSAVFILDGRGAGEWRDVTANHGRSWEIDRPFDVAPDASSVVSIVPFNGRVLIVGNHFEDANWVNAGYGTSIDVVCAENELLRCADMMNYGVRAEDWYEPSWHVQYFDNKVTQGQTGVGSTGDGHGAARYTGPLTCWAVHRRHTLTADNSGSISIGGNVRDAIVEGCVLKNPQSVIKADPATQGVVLRNNTFEGTPSPRYTGDGIKNAVVQPAEPARPSRP
ncbi:MAG: hypothetical protein JWP03_503 [Phycisphaerales bacterium]|nr:hypothetical protein [Phycisphaerales bacterium]